MMDTDWCVSSAVLRAAESMLMRFPHVFDPPASEEDGTVACALWPDTTPTRHDTTRSGVHRADV